MEENKIIENAEAPLGHILYCLSRSIITDLSRVFAANSIEISVEQYRSLYIISKYSGNSQQWLCQTLLVDKSSLSRLIDSLIQKGLVRREKVRGCGNQYAVFATEEGNRMVQRCYTLSAELVNTVSAGFSSDERKGLRGDLCRLLVNSGRDPARL